MGSGNGVIEWLQAGLRAASLRQAAIANNIANMNTPGYRRRMVEFEKRLAEALESGGRVDLGRIRPQVVEPGTGPLNGVGSDVRMETEVGELIKNVSTYKVYLRLLAKMYRQMELAMQP
jgi:flagellar basal-body rod protein FlgB